MPTGPAVSGRLSLGFITLAATLVAWPPLAAQQAQAPVFRGGAVVVPIDLRVLDKTGRLVTDLEASEVSLFEDGVRQDVRHFQRLALGPEPTDADVRLARRQPLSQDVTPQHRRVFLIVLGRGRLQEPSKGLDALLLFVRGRLLPQDRVAVLAYDRATGFTTDHDQIAAVIERFRVRHEGIEQGLKDHLSGLAGIYGNKQLPDKLRRNIDEIFDDRPATAVREIPASPVPNGERIDADTVRMATMLQHTPEIDAVGRAEISLVDMPFDQFVSSTRQTMQDVGNLYTGIEYLRQIDGEKHLVFVTEQGISLPRVEDDRSLAAVASDARVAIDTIQTGGLPGGPTPADQQATLAPAAVTAPPGTPVMPGPSLRQTLAIGTLKTISELTGGQASLYARAEGAVDRINATTRFAYLVAYAPQNAMLDGRYRRIRIEVNRPEVTVLYRHGYYARAELTPFDRQQYVTASRMQAAAAYRRDIRDIKLDARAKATKGTGAFPDVAVTASIDPSRVSFHETPAERTATLAIAVVCLDSRSRVIGQSAQELQIRLLDADYQRALKDGLPFNDLVPLRRKRGRSRSSCTTTSRISWGRRSQA